MAGNKSKSYVPGTQGAGTAEGVVPDARMQATVHILLSGTPTAIAADYATLVTNATALATCANIDVNKS